MSLATYTASIFQIEPLSGTPIEPLFDLVPGLSPLRTTFDTVDGESATFTYDVTEHAIQGFLDVTTNVRKRLEQVTITGTLNATGPLLPVPIAPGGVGGQVAGALGLKRLDKLRFENIVAMADRRLPVLIVTPRVRLARAFIANVTEQWSPADGDSLVISITAKEARFVLPGIATQVAPDFAAQAPGNNSTSDGGQVGPTELFDVEATPPETPGVAPSLPTTL